MPNIAFNEAGAFPPKIMDTVNDIARKGEGDFLQTPYPIIAL